MSNRKWLSLTAAAAFVLPASLAFGQTAPTRPMPYDPYDPTTHSQRRDQQQANQGAYPAGQDRAPDARDDQHGPFGGSDRGGMSGGYNQTGPEDYPADEVQAIPPARARAVFARAQYDRSQRALHNVVDQLRANFTSSNDMLDSVRAEKQAHDTYDAERKRVLDRLAQDEEYRLLKKLSGDLKKKLELLNDNPRENYEDIVATAAVRLNYGTKITQMESDALAGDQTVVNAKKQMTDAGLRVAAMRQAFERTIRRDEQFLAARNAMDDAKIAQLTSDAYLQAAVNAREIALDYAYWLRRWDQYRYAGSSYGYPYPYYGYGYNSVTYPNGGYYGGGYSRMRYR